MDIDHVMYWHHGLHNNECIYHYYGLWLASILKRVVAINVGLA